MEGDGGHLVRVDRVEGDTGMLLVVGHTQRELGGVIIDRRRESSYEAPTPSGLALGFGAQCPSACPPLPGAGETLFLTSYCRGAHLCSVSVLLIADGVGTSIGSGARHA